MHDRYYSAVNPSGRSAQEAIGTAGVQRKAVVFTPAQHNNAGLVKASPARPQPLQFIPQLKQSSGEQLPGRFTLPAGPVVQRKIGAEIEVKGQLTYTSPENFAQGTSVATMMVNGQPTEIHLEHPKKLDDTNGIATLEFATGKYNQPDVALNSALAEGTREISSAAGALTQGQTVPLTSMQGIALTADGLKMNEGAGPQVIINQKTGSFQVNVSPTKESAIDLHEYLDMNQGVSQSIVDNSYKVDKRPSAQPRDMAVLFTNEVYKIIVDIIEKSVEATTPMPPYLKAAIRTMADIATVYWGRIEESLNPEGIDTNIEKNRFPVNTRTDIEALWRETLKDPTVSAWINGRNMDKELLSGFEQALPEMLKEKYALRREKEVTGYSNEVRAKELEGEQKLYLRLFMLNQTEELNRKLTEIAIELKSLMVTDVQVTDKGDEMIGQTMNALNAVLKRNLLLLAPRKKDDPRREIPAILPKERTDTTYVDIDEEAPAGVKEVRDPFRFGDLSFGAWKDAVIFYEAELAKAGVKY
ncbi:hypothetical protein [Chitinophaga sp. GbtcB8]|uniref:hypothetical protein n=1 Tax=Chitinophaga sp. GbtcB8 TaxID=2824753 RepID=UPI001C30A1BB|nr:hypothetical protein [Chitinophaga sp. GbtcB8]